jgi:hypothetical protein
LGRPAGAGIRPNHAPARIYDCEPAGPVIPVAVEPDPAPLTIPSAPAPAAKPVLETAPLELPAPRFTQVAPERSWRWLRVTVAIAAGVGLGYGVYRLYQHGVPPGVAWVRPIPRSADRPATTAAGYLGLRTFDTSGQLWIGWDRGATAVRTAQGGSLTIREGAATQTIELDSAQIQAGSFTYGRQAERVDLVLTLNGPEGETREVTTYIGKLPGSAPPDSPQRLANELMTERARTKQLEKSLAEAVTKLQKQQERRLANQTADR